MSTEASMGNGKHSTNERSSKVKPREPASLAELIKRNVETIAALEQAANGKRGPGERLAAGLTRFAGSMGFVYLHLAWFGVWIAVNSIPALPEHWRIDPFPFTFLTFVVSLEAIFLSTFILISQNHEERLTERRNHLDLQINLLAEQESSKTLLMLEAIHKHLGIEDQDPDLHVLEEATHPDQLIDQIDKIMDPAQQAERPSPDEGRTIVE